MIKKPSPAPSHLPYKIQLLSPASFRRGLYCRGRQAFNRTVSSNGLHIHIQRSHAVGTLVWQGNDLERALPSTGTGVPFTSVRTQSKWVGCPWCPRFSPSASITQTCSFLSISSLRQLMQIFFSLRQGGSFLRKAGYKSEDASSNVFVLW